MKLKLSKRAQADLEDIRIYTETDFGQRQADIYRGALMQGLSTLRRFPEIGLHYEDLPEPVRAFRVKHHWLCYEIEDDTLLILAVIKRLDAL